jgi:peroxiredoxin
MTMNIPTVDHYFADGDGVAILTTKDLFLGRRTVLFCVPGAFESVSSTQLLGFEAAYADLTDNNVDQVLCVSVNDGWVMDAWGESLGIENVQLVPDGNGYFTQGLKAVVANENTGEVCGRGALRLSSMKTESWNGLESRKVSEQMLPTVHTKRPHQAMSSLRSKN